MRNISYLISFVLLTGLLFGQQTDSTAGKWIPSMVTGANLSQISFTNWAKGGDNSISWTLSGNVKMNYKSPVWNFKNQLNAVYGRTKLGDEDFRTNDNDIYLENVISYKIGWAVDPFFSNTVRTQITKGYDYTDGASLEIADFFDPGYVTQSIGFTYDKHANFTTRLGLAFQETFADKYRAKYTDDEETTDEVEAFKFETGLESVSDAELTLDDNLIWKSKLRLFSAFETIDVWDVRFDNQFTAKVNSWLNVNLGLLLIYEKIQSPKTQFKQALQIGITYTII